MVSSIIFSSDIFALENLFSPLLTTILTIMGSETDEKNGIIGAFGIKIGENGLKRAIPS